MASPSRHVPALDGLRAVAVVLVLTWHEGVSVLAPLRGYLGVAVFFVLSGYLITTLLLAEEDRDGRVSLAAFAVRRAFRILPLYVLALAVDVVLVEVLGRGADPAVFAADLPYFLSFTNEFATPGTFGHTWSLGVEEKFYVVWPLLLCGIAGLRRYRGAVAGVLLVAAVAAAWLPGASYLALYAPILAGCVVAVAARDPRARTAVTLLARPTVGAVVVVAAVLVGSTARDTHVHVGFGLLVALTLPSLVAGRGPLARGLAHPALQWVGRRSYAVYLFAPAVASAIALALPTPGVGRLLVVTASTLLVAEVLHHTVERPLQQRGRRWSSSRRPVPQAVTA